MNLFRGGNNKKLITPAKFRENFLRGFIGTNRTGKSLEMLKIAIDWRASRPSHHKIIAFDPQRRFVKVSDHEISMNDKDWAIRLKNFPNSLVILDDYKLINRTPHAVKGLEILMAFRNEYNIDIMYATHNPMQVLNLLTYYTTHWHIFFTNSQECQFEDKMPNYTLCLAASYEINQYVRRFGKGEYPGPFPYVLVDGERDKPLAINMKRNISESKI